MDPKEVAEKYLHQAKMLHTFLNTFETKICSEDDYKIIIKTIAECYYKLLISLAAQVSSQQCSFMFFEIKPLAAPEKDLSEPPFEKEFFEKERK